MEAPKNLWLAVTRDEFEFPIYIADSAEELAELTGKATNTIRSMASKYKKGKVKFSRYRRVKLDDEVE